MRHPPRPDPGSKPPQRARSRRRPWWSDALPYLGVILLILSIYVLPPDTTLQEVRRVGTLRVCVPDSYPPLVSSNTEMPGIDVELVRQLADRLGVRLLLVNNQAIGRDFNPRNWGLSRAQCLVIAGGIVVSPTTSSFLDTLPPHLESGWAAVRMSSESVLEGAVVGFFAGTSGLDRIGLARFLRGQGATVRIVHARDELETALRDRVVDIAVTESLTAQQIASNTGGEAMWLPGDLGRYPIALGLWRGDLSLKRGLRTALRTLETDGTLASILERYALNPLGERCLVCKEID